MNNHSRIISTMKKIIHTIFFCHVIMAVAGQSHPVTLKNKKSTTLIYKADFTKALDPKEWVTEIEPQGHSTIYATNGQLVVDSRGGVTVWLNRKLEGSILIEYERTVLVEGKENDRLSDMNQFWMALDPRNPDLFTRNGSFEAYDSLRLYYVGMGGNTNSTTRFRKYDGAGNKRLLGEFTDADHLLRPNKKYRICIVLEDNVTSYWVDDERYFTYRDPDPLRAGYVGFRSVYSRQIIENFTIYLLR
jgi:rhamnogalacturonan endolyase